MVDNLKTAGWGPPPADLSLNEGEVHVWRGIVKASNDELSQMMGALSQTERQQAESMERPKVFVARMYMLRQLLGLYTARDPAEVQLPAHGADRPTPAASNGALRWDLAWGERRALFAVSAARPLGVHLEVVPPDGDVSAYEARMPRRERALADFLSPTGRARAIVGYHAEQEARSRLAAQVDASGAAPEGQVERLRLGKRYVAALAAEGWDWSLSLWRYGEDDPIADDDG